MGHHRTNRGPQIAARPARHPCEPQKRPDRRRGVPPTFRIADRIGSASKGIEELARKYEKYKPVFRDEVARLVVETTRSIADVSREYGRDETTVGGWVKKYRVTHAADKPPLELSERARLRELERRNRELEMENAFLKKASAYFAREQR